MTIDSIDSIAMQNFCKSQSLCGVTAQEASDAIYNAMKKVKFDPQEEIALVKINPSISFIQRWLIIRRLKKLKN